MNNSEENRSGEPGPKTGPLPSLHPLPGSTGYTVNGQYGHTEYKTMLEAMEDNRIFTIKQTAGVFEIREHCDRWYWADLTPDQLRALGQELIDLSNVKDTCEGSK